MFVFKEPLEKKKIETVTGSAKLPNYHAREPRPHYQTKRTDAHTPALSSSSRPKEKKGGRKKAPLYKEVSLKSGMHPDCLKTRFIPDTFP